jgi:ubiquinone/menaquinone biosynthesis C-methylase UbiE
MKLNRVEKWLINSRLRATAQRRYEAPLLERLGGRLEGGRVLEVGCGQGVGTEIIFERFGAREICAFDLDPEMVKKARRRLSRYLPDRLELYVGDATAIKAEDESFDAVFDFMIIHHVPDWQRAVAEIARVLRPEGRFFFAEVTRQALERWSYRMLFDHPPDNRFSREDFVVEVRRHGIAMNGKVEERFFGDFIYGVGHRCPAQQHI